MVNVKKGDFIELDYTGRFTDNKVFDTNVKAVADKEHLHKHDFKPLKVVVGENQVIKGLDKSLEGCELNKEYKFEIKAEEAYGKKDTRLIRVISKEIFTKQKMNPYPGMQITAEGAMGIIRSVSGGRVSVDFNHQLAGKDLIFEIKVIKLVENTKEKVTSLISNLLYINEDKYSLHLEGDALKIVFKFKLPELMQTVVKEKILDLIKDIKKVEFSFEKEATTSV